MAEQPEQSQTPTGGPSPLPAGIPFGFWSGETLLRIEKSGIELIKPFNQDQIDCNSYTLRVGNHYFVTSAKADSEPPTREEVKDGDDFNIPPGQFAYLISAEDVSIPPFAMAFISMRTGFKFKGLVNVSGFHVDPGYKGKLIFAVYNAGPALVQLSGGELLFKIWFASLDQQSAKPYIYDKPPIKSIDKGLIHGMTRELLSLQQLNEKIREVENSVNLKLQKFEPTMDNLQVIWRSVIMAVIFSVTIAVVNTFWPTALLRLWTFGQQTTTPATQSAPPPVAPPEAPQKKQ